MNENLEFLSNQIYEHIKLVFKSKPENLSFIKNTDYIKENWPDHQSSSGLEDLMPWPLEYVVKRFVYDREHKNGWWREEEMFDSVPACENYIKASSYKAKGETGRFGIYKTQLIKFVGEE